MGTELDLKSLQINLRHTHESTGVSKSVAMKLIQELEETRAKHRKAWGRAEKAEAAVARVRELHPMEKHGVRWHCGECLQDDNTGSWEYVEYPCPTIRALDGEPNE